ncbi:hypothetical protein GCM10009087_33460 [Sphingomonas oligophenolica]
MPRLRETKTGPGALSDGGPRISGRIQHGQRNDDSTAIIARIIGFALGGASVGSQQDAQRAHDPVKILLAAKY